MQSNRYHNLALFIVGENDFLSHHLFHHLAHHGAPLHRRSDTFRSAIATLRTERFDCVIIDGNWSDGDGKVLAPIIKRVSPHCICILFTPESQWATIEASRILGFDEVISTHLNGEVAFSLFERALTSQALPHQQKKPPIGLHLLSLTEREILIEIGTGATTEEIAARRHNSVATIKSHLTSIYRKLGVRNRVEALAYIARE